uniref:receptor protein-tyrosine kinase n=1 Tax=Denticeps clupeoides TaxID=299321 RepID=A0AAY4CXP2_9TELE
SMLIRSLVNVLTPSISTLLVTTSDVVLSVGSRLELTCRGDAPVTWRPRSVRLSKPVTSRNGHSKTLKVTQAEAVHTGTYTCVYNNANLTRLYSAVHVFVRDPANPFRVASTSLRVVKKEGDDCLLPCLLSEPAATGMSLRMSNMSAVPASMNFTADPRRGITVYNLQPGYSADYVCTAQLGKKVLTSKSFRLNIVQRLRAPPYVFLKQDEYVRIVGEELRIICTTSNPNFNYNVTWKHSSGYAVEEVHARGSELHIESILTIPAVSLAHTGNVTCIGTNEAGVNSSTTYLQVVDKGYARLTSLLPPHGSLNVDVYEGSDLELRVLIEAYPPLRARGWNTQSAHNSSTQEQQFYSYNQHRGEATLILRRVNSQEQGLYTFSAQSEKANTSITFTVLMYQKPVAVVMRENRTTLTCSAYGYPAPKIFWYLCPGITNFENVTGMGSPTPLHGDTVAVRKEGFEAVEVESVLTIQPSEHSMTVECAATNLVGKGADIFTIEVCDKAFISYVSGGAGSIAFLILLLLILLYKYKQKPRYEVRWKIIEATNGNNYTFIDPTQLPYNEKWEFPRDKLKLGKILGAGAFGKVVSATAYGLGKEDTVTRVAVKMLKASAHSDEKEALMSELKILSHIGQHKNIVNLLGACTYGGPVLVITEYCCHGDLLNFLRTKAETFLSFVMSMPGMTEEPCDYKNILGNKKFIRSDSGISSTCSQSYLEMRPAAQPVSGTSCGDSGDDSWPLDIDDLLRFSYHVAQGLDFLAAKNCIHRDVAARNVLLTDGRIAKICDFGLARDIMNDSNYVVKGNARLPVKWMAPESIFDCVYTVQSDVWSYGILLWEIFSLGKSPYPSILVDTKFYKMIKGGYQMQRPDFAPPEMYDIMRMCWNLEPTERPTFSKIGHMIERLLGDEVDSDQSYQNVQQDAAEPSQPENADKCSEESCDQPRATENREEQQPLMKANNYQFC